MPHVPTIVLTGGPCAGKSTALAVLQEWLLARGYRPIAVPETATVLRLSGFMPEEGVVTPFDFQHRIMTFQTMLETQLRGVAHHYPAEKKPVLLFDRGLMDSKAYVEPEIFEKVLEATGWRSKARIFERYDSVLHLRTAALGAEEHYTLANNAARFETPEEARLADEKTLDAWIGHLHLRVIANEPNMTFDDKIGRVKKHVAHVLGIPEPLEIERKFLIDEHRLGALPVPYILLHIEQTYLRTLNGECRVRATTLDGVTTYTQTTKRPVKAGVRIEEERVIPLRKYRELLYMKDPDRRTIRKNRHTFVWQNQYFELDVFIEPRAGLALLEVELTDLQDTVVLPPFVPIIKEVTDDPAYSNAHIALY